MQWKSDLLVFDFLGDVQYDSVRIDLQCQLQSETRMVAPISHWSSTFGIDSEDF
jgi:hypothetical protein